MSIAQARASRVRPHYILVALLLGVVAAIAFGTLAARAQTPGTRWSSMTPIGMGCLGPETARQLMSPTVSILSDGSVDLTVSSDVATSDEARVTEVGLLTTSEGSLGSEDGPTTMIIVWTREITDDSVTRVHVNVKAKPKYFPSGYVGPATIVANNFTGGMNNAPFTATSHAAPLDIEVVFSALAPDAGVDAATVDVDRIGVSRLRRLPLQERGHHRHGEGREEHSCIRGGC